MSAKILTRGLLAASLVVLVALLLVNIQPVHAQCGDQPPSSCLTCHAVEDPVDENGEWHIIHASKDICLSCHGGNGTTLDKELAHDGMTAHPLEDIYTDCHSCHPDYDERAQQFSITLGVTPGSCATPTPIPAPVGDSSSGSPSSSVYVPNGAASTVWESIAVIASGLVVLAIFFLGLQWLEHHHIPG